MNLPNVPGQPVYTGGAMGAYNIPPGGPPPPDPSADALPEKISNNMQVRTVSFAFCLLLIFHPICAKSSHIKFN